MRFFLIGVLPPDVDYQALINFMGEHRIQFTASSDVDTIKDFMKMHAAQMSASSTSGAAHLQPAATDTTTLPVSTSSIRPPGASENSASSTNSGEPRVHPAASATSALQVPVIYRRPEQVQNVLPAMLPAPGHLNRAPPSAQNMLFSTANNSGALHPTLLAALRTSAVNHPRPSPPAQITPILREQNRSATANWRLPIPPQLGIPSLPINTHIQHLNHPFTGHYMPQCPPPTPQLFHRAFVFGPPPAPVLAPRNTPQDAATPPAYADPVVQEGREVEDVGPVANQDEVDSAPAISSTPPETWNLGETLGTAISTDNEDTMEAVLDVKPIVQNIATLEPKQNQSTSTAAESPARCAEWTPSENHGASAPAESPAGTEWIPARIKVEHSTESEHLEPQSSPNVLQDLFREDPTKMDVGQMEHEGSPELGDFEVNNYGVGVDFAMNEDVTQNSVDSLMNSQETLTEDFEETEDTADDEYMPTYSQRKRMEDYVDLRKAGNPSKAKNKKKKAGKMGRRPYTCEMCQKHFTTTGFLERHKKRFHRVILKIPRDLSTSPQASHN